MLRFLTAGESHGKALTGILEGCPAHVPLAPEYIDLHLRRRWQGVGRGGRSKVEDDRIQIFSGIRFGHTIGSPIGMLLPNAAYEADRAGWPEIMRIDGSGEGIEPITMPRPGHADLAGWQKYKYHSATGKPDLRPVIERASARETAMRVACCSVARRLLEELGIHVGSHVTRIGHIGLETPSSRVSEILQDGSGKDIYEAADESPVRMLDKELSLRAVKHIEEVRKAGDSLGGIYEVIVTGVLPGLGSYVQADRRLDARLGQAILSIPAQKAVEIGDGIAAAKRPGSTVHDPIIHNDSGEYARSSNHAGGIEGGISNGMNIVVRGYMKPIPTLIKPLMSVDLATNEPQPTRYERSDVTSVPAAATVAEAVVAFELANAILEKFGGDTLEEIRQRMVP